MQSWWKTSAGAYVNPASCVSVYPRQDGTDWVLVVHMPVVSLTSGSNPESILSGIYTSEAEALEVAQRLVLGIDTSTLL